MLINLLLITVIQFSALFMPAQPEFKGGQRNLSLFIANNLIYPEYAKQNCLQGTIYVSFKLNKQGRIFDSEIHKGFGVDLDDEALRIVRLTSGKWIVPPTHDTTSALILPVNFSLKEYECESRSADNIKGAIAAYKARENLTNAIFNFYDKKSQGGKYSQTEEAHILILKGQLGYDEKYIAKLLKQAQRKVKQGDKESACDDFQTIRKLGSNKADSWIDKNCGLNH